MAGPLTGIRVLDLSRVLAGPYASMVLADLGAEVIKVELPGIGDEARGFGPFYQGESAYFMSVNRGKKGVTIDLRKPRGSELVKGLAAKCDVLLENFRPGTMERFGLDYETLRAVNPALIWASISGFGQTGPYSAQAAYDAIVQGISGIVSITGSPDGPPVRVGTSIGDLSAALFTVIGILSALYARGWTGKGQHLDIAMLDTLVAFLENAVVRYTATGEIPKPLGSRHPAITPFDFFETSDGYLVIAAGNDALWRKLCEVLELEGLIDDEQFCTNAKRTENYEKLRPLLVQKLGTKTTEKWVDLLGGAGVPCGPINTIDQVVHDAHVNARDMIIDLEHPKGENLKIAGSPLKFSEDAVELKKSAPLLGEHTDEVLGDIVALSESEIEQLRKEGVI